MQASATVHPTSRPLVFSHNGHVRERR